MSRYCGWTHAAVERHLGQKLAPQPQEPCTGSRRLQPVLGSQRPAWSRVEPTATGYIFTYVGWIPRIVGHQLNRYARSRLCKLARQAFGELPPCLHERRRARVEVIRVLGPRQKPMDLDSLAQLAAGVIDGLKRGGYLKDDSELWVSIRYHNDGSSRQTGPYIKIIVEYEEP